MFRQRREAIDLSLGKKKKGAKKKKKKKRLAFGAPEAAVDPPSLADFPAEAAGEIELAEPGSRVLNEYEYDMHDGQGSGTDEAPDEERKSHG